MTRSSAAVLGLMLATAVACSSSGTTSDAGADGATADASAFDASAGDAHADGAADADAAPPIVPTPYTCAQGAPEAIFVGEVSPPSTMTPWQHASVSVTYANCGTATWSATQAPPAGIKLGPAAPHDLATWSPGRIALPADVPPGFQIQIPIDVHAPALTGTHAYAFELVRDGVAWLGQPSPTHTIDVEAAPASPVTICGSTTTDPSGATDATAALQSCINATPSGGTLSLPAGIYRLTGVLSIGHPMTLTTNGTSGAAGCLDYATLPCAVFRADASTAPNGARGFFRIGTTAMQVSSVTLDHVVVDGNRGARLSSASATQCSQGNNGEGINVGANCASCTIAHVGSARALCGSGMEWDGDGIHVTDSVFLGNGDHATTNMWSDGLTIHKSNGGVVDHSSFIDNSDVGFISGGGTNAQYTNDVVEQLTQAAFAGMMLDNFNSGALGDHTGAVLSNNLVACPAICHFGIELGPHPWYASPNIYGGTVTNNTVVGAYIQINAQGAGTQSAPVVISNNTLGATPSSAKFTCGTVNGLSPLNVSNDSIVDLKGGSATGSISVPCP
jgi:hypothetical protein